MREICISVIMCAYNAEETISESVESILEQSFTDFELIIINDGSIDKTSSIIGNIKDSRIVLIEQENHGPSIARDNGIKISKGEYIAILDADDIALPKRLERQINFLKENKEYILVGSNAEVVDKNLEYIYTSCLPLAHNDIYNKLPDVPFFHSAVMFRKNVYQICGGYHTDDKLYIFEDALLWNQMKEYGKMANLEEPLIKYRLMPFSASTKSGKESIITNNIYKDTIANKGISEENRKQLIEFKLATDKKGRLFNYHMHLSRKYLWNNYSPMKARKNLILAMKIKPFRISTIILFLMTILPKKLILKIHSAKNWFGMDFPHEVCQQ